MKIKWKLRTRSLITPNLVSSIFAIGLAMTVGAQSKVIKKGSQEWIQYYAERNISNKWIWSIDGGYRWNELLKNSSQYIVRTGFGYKLNCDMNVAAGFAHLGVYKSGKISKFEYRPYEEFALSNNYNNLSIGHRFRIEERYFKSVNYGQIHPGDTFNFRFRYQIMVKCKILNLSPTKRDKTISLSLGDEIFINTGKEIVYDVFDQNRFLISPIISFTKNCNLGITYNSQFAATTTPKNYVHTDVFWLTIKQKF